VNGKIELQRRVKAISYLQSIDSVFSTYAEEHYRVDPGIATCIRQFSYLLWTYLLGKSLGGQGDAKEVALL
jgi:hypothetical protein